MVFLNGNPSPPYKITDQRAFDGPFVILEIKIFFTSIPFWDIIAPYSKRIISHEK